MINDPVVIVECDKCGHEDGYDMCALTRGSWDTRYLKDQMARDNWLVDGGSTICYNCQGDDE